MLNALSAWVSPLRRSRGIKQDGFRGAGGGWLCYGCQAILGLLRLVPKLQKKIERKTNFGWLQEVRCPLKQLRYFGYCFNYYVFKYFYSFWCLKCCRSVSKVSLTYLLALSITSSSNDDYINVISFGDQLDHLLGTSALHVHQ